MNEWSFGALDKARLGCAANCRTGASYGSTPSACPMCRVSGNGGCSTPSSLISDDIRSATAAITLDARYGLDAPGPAAPSPSPGAAPTPTVELIFND